MAVLTENVIKSTFVLLFLMAFVIFSIKKIIQWMKARKKGGSRTKKLCIAILSCAVSLALILLLGDFTYPFERQLEPELVSEIELLPEYSPKGLYGCEEWNAVYEAYGFFPGTWVHYHEEYQDGAINEWPAMDLENYTYIITYCQKIESLTYNVWETTGEPIFGGAKAGHMVFAEEVDPLFIYIYRIPKMRINNPIIC